MDGSERVLRTFWFVLFLLYFIQPVSQTPTQRAFAAAVVTSTQRQKSQRLLVPLWSSSFPLFLLQSLLVFRALARR